MFDSFVVDIYYHMSLRTHIIGNKETFVLHLTLGYLKELCNGHGIEPFLTPTVSLKSELLK